MPASLTELSGEAGLTLMEASIENSGKGETRPKKNRSVHSIEREAIQVEPSTTGGAHEGPNGSVSRNRVVRDAGVCEQRTRFYP